jgi:hypothetical protein
MARVVPPLKSYGLNRRSYLRYERERKIMRGWGDIEVRVGNYR